MNQRWADYCVFWRQFRQAYHTTGAVLPSGQALAAALCHYVRSGAANSVTREPAASPSVRRILEVGPGTGAVTGHIVRDMRDGDRLVLVERNAEFVALLRERLNNEAAYKTVANRVSIVHATVEELPEDEPYDVVISGLPLNNFTAGVVDQIFTKIRRLMCGSATLSFFEYIAIRRFKAAVSRQADRERVRAIAEVLGCVLKQHEIRRDAVWANVPPAWVHHVRFGN